MDEKTYPIERPYGELFITEHESFYEIGVTKSHKVVATVKKTVQKANAPIISWHKWGMQSLSSAEFFNLALGLAIEIGHEIESDLWKTE